MASTGAVLYLTIRGIGGLWTGGGVGASANLDGSRARMPSVREPVAYVSGQPIFLTPAWERFFRFQHEVRLGGDAGSTLPDIVAAVETTQATAAASSVQSAAFAQQSQANASSLAATVQVLQNNAVPGSAQIPPVSLNPLEQIP